VGYFDFCISVQHGKNGVMPKRLSKKSSDPNVSAFQTVNKFAQAANPPEEDDKPTRAEVSRIMAAMGRKGGKKSAKARMEKISPHARSRIALKAAQARWAQKQDKRS
jgi:hypothetical protein